MNKRVIYFFGILLALTVLLTSCSDDDTEDPGETPVLPPVESLVVDFGNFPTASSGRVDLTRLNYGFAALNVVYWQSILTVDLAIPVAAFYGAFNHPFTYQRDLEKWKSEYTVTVGNKTITAELLAQRVPVDENASSIAQISWEMYLSSEGNFDRFLWFSGISNNDQSGGTWILYKSPSEPREILHVEWVRQEGTPIRSTYELVDSEADRSGSNIQYGETDEAGFSHFYVVSIVGETTEDYDLQIFFNEETKIGRVKSLAWYQDEAWHCWDENLDDVTCE